MGCLVVHTTETPAGTAQAVARQLLARGAAPHQVYDPATGTLVHCHDWDTPAAALKNLAGGVQTNRRGGVYQVEIVGYAGEVPGYGDQWYENLGRYLSTVCDQTGVPKVFPYPFTGNDGYGAHGTVRLSNQEWLNAAGILGHAHVPENSHWDPGRLDVARLAPHMNPAPPALPPIVDHGSFDMSTCQTKLVPVGPLDPNGCGWNEAPFEPFTRIISATPNGPYPPVDGYWFIPATVSAQARGDKAIVTVTGGQSGSTVNVWITVS